MKVLKIIKRLKKAREKGLTGLLVKPDMLIETFLKHLWVVCVSLSNIVGYCIQHENYRIHRFKFDSLLHSYEDSKTASFFPACANCLVAVVDSTTFLHCKWVKVSVHEALTEKTI